MEMRPDEIEQAERIGAYLRERQLERAAAERRKRALAGPYGQEIIALEKQAEILFVRMEATMADAFCDARTLYEHEKERFDAASQERQAVLEKAAKLIRQAEREAGASA